MKKLFSLLIAVVLSAGMAVQAQLVLKAADNTRESGTVSQKTGRLNGQRKAPQTDWYGSWLYADQGNSVMNTNGCKQVYSSGSQRVWLYQWDSDLQMYFCFNNTNTGSWTSPISGATVTMPPKGAYIIHSSRAAGRIGNIDAQFSGSYTCSRYVEDGTSFYFYSGTWYVSEGVDGPYMYCTNLSIRYIYSNNYYDPMEGEPLAFQIGEPAVYRNVSVTSENTAKGTAVYAMKSGYVYTNDITEWKDGSVYTLTATPKQGYRFVDWKKNGSRISTSATTDVTIAGDATYTAYFIPNYDSEVDITVTTVGSYIDNTGAAAEWQSWSFAGSGTGTDSKQYSVTLKFNTSTTTGSFGSAMADAEVTSLYQGATKIAWTSVTATVTEEAGVYTLTATFAGADNKKYVVTSIITDECVTNQQEEPQTAWYAAYKFNNSSDHITVDVFTDPEVWEDPGYGMWWPRDNIRFIRIAAYNSSKTYVQCFLWAGANLDANTQAYANGITGPKAGTYSKSVDPDVYTTEDASEGLSVWWVSDVSNVSSGKAIFFNQRGWTYNGYWSGYDDIYIECMYSTFVATRNSSTSFSNIQSMEGFSINVAEGKDGYPYIEFIDTKGAVAITIGEPVVQSGYKLDTYVNGHGSVTVSPEECLYAEGTEVILTPVPDSDRGMFTGWTGGCADLIKDNGDGTFTFTVPAYDCAVIANFEEGASHNVTFVNYDETVLQSGQVKEDETPVYTGETPVKPQDNYFTYTFSGWSDGTTTYAADAELPAVTEDVTYTAVFTSEQRLFTVHFKNPDSDDALQTSQVAYGETPVFDGTPAREKDGDEYNWYEFTFTGWADSEGTIYKAGTELPAVTQDTVYTAQYSKALYIILQENMDADYYTSFSDKYNGEKAASATLERQFGQGKWATLCLPFNVPTALLTNLKMMNRVYEFRYTQGSEAEGLTLYFAQAKKLEAGKGYIVNANATLAQKESFLFPGVTINTEADINSGFDLTNLEGYNSQGSIYLVGTLRTGVVMGSETGNTYMGLKDNKIYAPNSQTGTKLRAYRGIFRNAGNEQLPARVRIVVEGEDGEQVNELEVINGSLEEVAVPKKYIRNGILYIERNGMQFDAQGQRLD